MMIVHHIGYLVKDIEKSYKKFQILGFERESDVVYDDYRDINILFIKNGNERVELIAPVSENSIVFDLYKKYKNCAYHICYISQNFDEDIAIIKNNGGIQIDAPHEAIALNNKKVVFFMFSAIGMIELVES